MHSVTNISRVSQSVATKSGRVILKPGETRSVALVDRDSPINRGREIGGTLLITDSRQATARAKPSLPRDPTPPEPAPDTGSVSS